MQKIRVLKGDLIRHEGVILGKGMFGGYDCLISGFQVVLFDGEFEIIK
jgi:hypothetical protein